MPDTAFLPDHIDVTSYDDWSEVSGDIRERFPIVPEPVPEPALRATLGISDRTVRKGW